MLATITGRDFVGYTGLIKCAQCGNESRHQLFQKYEDEIFIFLKMGKLYSQVDCICPICEKKSFIATPATKRKPATGLDTLLKYLDSGKEQTKDWYLSLPSKTRDKVLERYYSFEAFDFMRFLLRD